MNKENFGQRLSKLRVKQGWTMQQLAEKTGKSKATIFYYESGDRMPSYDVLFDLTKVLHTSVEYLLYGENDGRRVIDVSDLSDENIALLSEILELMRDKTKK